jgi:hypothetical protein
MKRAIEQFSYERSSQAQKSIIPPNLLICGGLSIFEGLAWLVCQLN